LATADFLQGDQVVTCALEGSQGLSREGNRSGGQGAAAMVGNGDLVQGRLKQKALRTGTGENKGA
jgi:hypothetical protein